MGLDAGTVIGLLNALGSHLSTWMFVNGLVTLVPTAIRRSSNPAVKTLDPIVAFIQLVVGCLTMWSGGYYLATVFQGGRPLNLPAAVALLGGGFSSFASATRRWPWAVVFGLGVGGVGAFSIYNLASGLTQWWLGGAIIVFVLLFYAVWYLTKPSEELMHKLGAATSWTPFALVSGTLQAVFGVITALGVVVL